MLLYASEWLHCVSRNNWVTTNYSLLITWRKIKKVESNWKAKKLAASQVLLLSEWQKALPHCVTKIYRSSYRQKKINSLHMQYLLAKMNWKVLIRPAGERMLTQSSTRLHRPRVFFTNSSQKRTLYVKEKGGCIGQGKLTERAASPSPLAKDAGRGTNKHHMLYLAGCDDLELSCRHRARVCTHSSSDKGDTSLTSCCLPIAKFPLKEVTQPSSPCCWPLWNRRDWAAALLPTQGRRKQPQVATKPAASNTWVGKKGQLPHSLLIFSCAVFHTGCKIWTAKHRCKRRACPIEPKLLKFPSLQ